MEQFMKKTLGLLLIILAAFTLSAIAQTSPWKTGVAITCTDGRTIPAGTAISGPNVTAADLCGSSAGASATDGTPEDIARVNQLESATGYTFLATRDPSVTVYHATKSNGDIKVVLAIDSKDNTMVIFCTVTTSASMPSNNAAFYRSLLHYNHEFGSVKVGLDADYDLSVRVDVTLRTLDAQDLKRIIDQVADVSNSILTNIKPQLVN
jgi:hypothetical protein